MGFADCIAAGVAGCDEPAASIVRVTIPSRAPAGEATLIGDLARATALDAALANGVACHVLDFDDFALFSHTSAVLVPAILALGEANGASGPDAICAYIAGYEIWSDLIGRDADLHHVKGWHPTGVFGTVAAAAAVAKIRQLDINRTIHSIGIAASMAAGVTANFGSMSKSWVAGRAAQNGILAVQMAEAGMTAAPNVLEADPGFLHAVSARGIIDLEREPTCGRNWAIVRQGLSLKQYPVCIWGHRAIDATMTILARRPIPVNEVKSIEVLLGATEASILKYHAPRTALESKFSIEFMLAAAVISQSVALQQVTDSFVARADVQRLIGLVAIQITTDTDPAVPARSRYTRVTVEMMDGTVISSPEIREAHGSPSLPLTQQELRSKFSGCVQSRLGKARTDSLFRKLLGLDQLESIAEVARATAQVSDSMLPGPAQN